MSRAQQTSTVEQNTGGAVAPFLAGKNKIINGDFNIWQRGTSFSTSANTATYTADRFSSNRDGSGATVTISQQSFTAGTAPVAGYEAAYFYRYNQSVAGTSGTYINIIQQFIEDVRTFAGQTITISFWAKADSNRTIVIGAGQIFGTGGSASVYYSTSANITTTWARYTATFNINSIASKTIGTNSCFQFYLQSTTNNATQTYDIWGVQLEAGSVATPFTTASGTLQGELALCQRYYWRWASTASSLYAYAGVGFCSSTTQFKIKLQPPVTMRTSISASISNATNMQIQTGNTSQNVTSASADQPIADSVGIIFNVSSGLTTGNGGIALANNSSAPYIELSAEL